MIKRVLESKIKSELKHFPAVAILGARQTGKTTLAKMLMQMLPKKCFYLDLENPEDTAMLTNPPAFFRANADKCIILDEIQRMPELFPLLRSIIDEKREPARFIILGSASSELLFMSSETLAGRIAYEELTPFVYPEIKENISINEHWFNGGFPQPCLTRDDEFRQNWFKSFFTTYIERDLRLLGLNASPNYLSRFFLMVAHFNGNILNKSIFAKSLELKVSTISTYIQYFERAFLLRILPPWHYNLKKRLVKSPKIYVRDSGLLHYLLRIKNYNALLGNYVLGNSWEGYVIEQIISCLGSRFDYYYYRTQDGTECDLVITDNIKPLVCVEIKFTSTPRRTKSFSTTIQDLKTNKNYIIIPECRMLYHLSENITVCDLQQFLDNFSAD